MNFLRKLYPSAFKLEKKVVKPFVIQLIIYVVLGIAMSVVSSLVTLLVGLTEITALIAIVGLLMYLITSVVGVYLTGGIVVSILKFAGVIKDQNQENENQENN